MAVIRHLLACPPHLTEHCIFLKALVNKNFKYICKNLDISESFFLTLKVLRV